MRGGGKSTFPKPTPDRRARIEFVEREGRKESVFWFLLLSLGLHTFEWRRSVPKFVMQIYGVRSEGKGGGRAPFRTYVRPLIPSEVEEEKRLSSSCRRPFWNWKCVRRRTGRNWTDLFSTRAEVPVVLASEHIR